MLFCYVKSFKVFIFENKMFGKSLKRLVDIDKVCYPIRSCKSCKGGKYFIKPGRPYKAHKAGHFHKPGQHSTKSTIL